MYRDAVNKKFGTDQNIPVVFYSQLMAVAFGMDPNTHAALDQNVIPATKLASMARNSGGGSQFGVNVVDRRYSPVPAQQWVTRRK